MPFERKKDHAKMFTKFNVSKYSLVKKNWHQNINSMLFAHQKLNYIRILLKRNYYNT